MAVTGVNNYTSYTNYYTDTTQKSSSEVAKTQQTTGKTYRDAREYRTYLTEKYDCLKSSDYSVAINSSLLAEATEDEKTSKWLEYNLALIPKVMDNVRSTVAARGSQIVSCNITINGYDSMTTDLVTKAEADPGTEKAREYLEEKIKKIKEEKKAEEEKAAEKRAEKRAAEEARIESGEYTISATGTNVKAVTQSIISAVLGTSAPMGVSFDVKA